MSAPQCEPEKEYEPVAVQLRIIEVGVNDCTFAATELGFPPTIEFGKAQANQQGCGERHDVPEVKVLLPHCQTNPPIHWEVDRCDH
jgi:hypothetical protein